MKYHPILGFPRLISLITAFIFSFTIAQAQLAEVRGTVYDGSTGETLPYVSIVLKGSGIGTRTDANGFYSITRIPPGTYDVRASVFGYDSSISSITLGPDAKLNTNFTLQPATQSVGETVITGQKSEDRNRPNISKIELAPRDLERLPSLGGEPDLAQYLQIVPGVVFSGDQGGQLYIRGGAPIQNLVLLDGMTIYNPFHSIGLFSVFDIDATRNIDIYTGGFGAEYGGRVSAVMDITTRDGNKKEFAGRASISPFTTKLLLEGPLKKFKSNGSGSSFLVTARNSFLRQSSPVIYPYAKGGLPYNFTDLYGKLSFYAPGGTQASFFGFRFDDDARLGVNRFGWTAFGVGGRLFILPPSSSTTIEATLAYSSYTSTLDEKDNPAPRSSTINGFDARLDFTYYPGKDLLRYGVNLVGLSTDYLFTNEVGNKLSQNSYNTEISVFARYTKVLGNLVVDPSFRLQYYASLSEFSPEPRLAAKYNVTEKLRLKGAAGLYSQNLLSAQSDRDVVNLFYGFLTAPDNTPAKFRGEEIQSKLQKAKHLIGGLEYDLTDNIRVQVEAYIKDFYQLTNVNRDKIFDDVPAFANKPARLRNDYIRESSLAKGIDFLVNYTSGRWYFWTAYSLAKVTRNDEISTYAPLWDRRHNLNTLLSYTFGPKKEWEISTRFSYGSGFPFTQTKGFYELLPFSDGVTSDYTSANGNLGILYGPNNEGRLSDFHRLDLSARRAFELKNFGTLRVIASAVNVYNRDNVFYFNRVTYQRVNQLPILPSLAVSLQF